MNRRTFLGAVIATTAFGAWNYAAEPATIILGHANAPTVTTLFPQLLELLASRGLATVTLNDVFIR